MLHNSFIVIMGMTQYISIKFFNTCYLDQHNIAGCVNVCVNAEDFLQEDDAS